MLHIDKNHYYGGAEAAFSLQEAEDWLKKVAEDIILNQTYTNISILQPSQEHSGTDASKLSFSRAYNLSLSPQIIYARSSLLPILVSSKVHRQLDFLAVGSWWVYSAKDGPNDTPGSEPSADRANSSQGKLVKVPSGREDIFADPSLDFKAKRALVKFLRFIVEFEDQPEVWEEHREKPFPVFLSEQFNFPAALQDPVISLTLSPSVPSRITTEFALRRIARHLRSIGMFGPGFGSVVPKWGGLSEISQVACRAGAVGGAVYVLGKGLVNPESINAPKYRPTGDTQKPSELKAYLQDGEAITTRWIVGLRNDLEPFYAQQHSNLEKHPDPGNSSTVCKSITIVSSALEPLFPALAEGAPQPAGAVVVFPSGSLALGEGSDQGEEIPPVYLLIHSGDTGECPTGQSVLYASVALGNERGFVLLEQAVKLLLRAINTEPTSTILWSLRYKQHTRIRPHWQSVSRENPSTSRQILEFSPSPPDLAFDDSTLDEVKESWQKILGDEAGEFMVFDDREGMGTDLDDNE